MMSTSMTFDYVVIGGGTAGCVIASRLIERQPVLSILLVEAGPDLTNNPYVKKPLDAAHLHGSDIDWKYMTTPQKHLDGKPRYNCGVKALSGGVAINAGEANTYLDFPSRLKNKQEAGSVALNLTTPNGLVKWAMIAGAIKAFSLTFAVANIISIRVMTLNNTGSMVPCTLLP